MGACLRLDGVVREWSNVKLYAVPVGELFAHDDTKWQPVEVLRQEGER